MSGDRTYRRMRLASAGLALLGLVTIGAAGHHWVSRVNDAAAGQARLAAQWRAADAAGPAGSGVSGSGAPAEDSPPVARLHLPTLRLALVVVDGDSDGDLRRGPGRITGTPAFGEPGNVGVAAHRYPGQFWDLDELRVGDAVVVETRDRFYVYRVSREMIVGPDDREALTAHPAGAPADAYHFLTLVTCHPILTTMFRLIRQATLVRIEPRGSAPGSGVPAELAGSRV